MAEDAKHLKRLAEGRDLHRQRIHGGPPRASNMFMTALSTHQRRVSPRLAHPTAMLLQFTSTSAAMLDSDHAPRFFCPGLSGTPASPTGAIIERSSRQRARRVLVSWRGEEGLKTAAKSTREQPDVDRRAGRQLSERARDAVDWSRSSLHA